MSILGRRRVAKTPSPRPSISAALIGSLNSGKAACSLSRTRLAAYPEAPKAALSSSQRDRYGRELAMSIVDGTAPVLITADEVCAALALKRVPEDLACVTLVPGCEGRRQGPDLYRSADVRAVLLGQRAAE
jgi:hypothetical protein